MTTTMVGATIMKNNSTAAAAAAEEEEAAGTTAAACTGFGGGGGGGEDGDHHHEMAVVGKVSLDDGDGDDDGDDGTQQHQYAARSENQDSNSNSNSIHNHSIHNPDGQHHHHQHRQQQQQQHAQDDDHQQDHHHHHNHPQQDQNNSNSNYLWNHHHYYPANYYYGQNQHHHPSQQQHHHDHDQDSNKSNPNHPSPSSHQQQYYHQYYHHPHQHQHQHPHQHPHPPPSYSPTTTTTAPTTAAAETDEEDAAASAGGGSVREEGAGVTAAGGGHNNHNHNHNHNHNNYHYHYPYHHSSSYPYPSPYNYNNNNNNNHYQCSGATVTAATGEVVAAATGEPDDDGDAGQKKQSESSSSSQAPHKFSINDDGVVGNSNSNNSTDAAAAAATVAAAAAAAADDAAEESAAFTYQYRPPPPPPTAPTAQSISTNAPTTNRDNQNQNHQSQCQSGPSAGGGGGEQQHQQEHQHPAASPLAIDTETAAAAAGGGGGGDGGGYYPHPPPYPSYYNYHHYPHPYPHPYNNPYPNPQHQIQHDHDHHGQEHGSQEQQQQQQQQQQQHQPQQQQEQEQEECSPQQHHPYPYPHPYYGYYYYPQTSHQQSSPNSHGDGEESGEATSYHHNHHHHHQGYPPPPHYDHSASSSSPTSTNDGTGTGTSSGTTGEEVSPSSYFQQYPYAYYPPYHPHAAYLPSSSSSSYPPPHPPYGGGHPHGHQPEHHEQDGHPSPSNNSNQENEEGTTTTNTAATSEESVANGGGKSDRTTLLNTTSQKNDADSGENTVAVGDPPDDHQLHENSRKRPRPSTTTGTSVDPSTNKESPHSSSESNSQFSSSSPSFLQNSSRQTKRMRQEGDDNDAGCGGGSENAKEKRHEGGEGNAISADGNTSATGGSGMEKSGRDRNVDNETESPTTNAAGTEAASTAAAAAAPAAVDGTVATTEPNPYHHPYTATSHHFPYLGYPPPHANYHPTAGVPQQYPGYYYPPTDSSQYYNYSSSPVGSNGGTSPSSFAVSFSGDTRLASTLSRHHPRPPRPSLADPSWTDPHYQALAEYVTEVQTCHVMYYPTMEYFCKRHAVTIESLLEWMSSENDLHRNMTVEEREESKSMALLGELGFPFQDDDDGDGDDCGGDDNHHFDHDGDSVIMSSGKRSAPRILMFPSRVQRRKAPFLGIITTPPTRQQVTEEALHQHRKGPLWDCFYLALSDYAKISGTMDLLFPNHMEIILKQFGEALEVHHLLTWMETQRDSYKTLTTRHLERQGSSTSSKVSCLQSIGFDWQYAMEVITDPSQDALLNVPLFYAGPERLHQQQGGRRSSLSPQSSTRNEGLSKHTGEGDGVCTDESSTKTETVSNIGTREDDESKEPTNQASSKGTEASNSECDVVGTKPPADEAKDNQTEVTKPSKQINDKNTPEDNHESQPKMVSDVSSISLLTPTPTPAAPASTTSSGALDSDNLQQKKEEYHRNIERSIFAGEADDHTRVYKKEMKHRTKKPTVVKKDPKQKVPSGANVQRGGRAGILAPAVEKAILQSMIPPHDKITFMNICNLFPERFGLPATRVRRACQNRRKYLERLQSSNSERFDDLLKDHGLIHLKDGRKKNDDGTPVSGWDQMFLTSEMDMLIKDAKMAEKAPSKDIIDKAILRSMLPPYDSIPFNDVCSTHPRIFDCANGGRNRAAKKRRREFDKLRADRPREFIELLRRHKINPEQPGDLASAFEADGGNDDTVKVVVGKNNEAKEAKDEKETSAVTMDRNVETNAPLDTLPLVHTDRLIIQFLLGPDDRRFATLCNLRPSQFGLPNSRLRRKVDDRKRYLRDMMKNNPPKFVELCRKTDVNLKMIGVDEGLILDRDGREKLDALGGRQGARTWKMNAASVVAPPVSHAPSAIATATTMAAMATQSTQPILASHSSTNDSKPAPESRNTYMI